MKLPCRVIIKGAGDLASAVAHRLWSAGFDILMLELPRPKAIRRTVSFAEAVYEGQAIVEGVEARLCRWPPEAEGGTAAGQNMEALAARDQERPPRPIAFPEIEEAWAHRIIPVLVDPGGKSLAFIKPQVLVDAVMAKRNTGTRITDASIVVALGPGFYAGRDVHALVETKRGHDLGRVIYQGAAALDTGIPGEIEGSTTDRLLRAPAGGIIEPLRKIGEMVEKGETVARVGGVPILAKTGGILRGMLYPGLEVEAGMKVGDIDPRREAAHCHTISDKARAVGGGVLEAVMRYGGVRL